ncbi:hypothetical protein Tco_0638493 [Tanacetum coccineum]
MNCQLLSYNTKSDPEEDPEEEDDEDPEKDPADYLAYRDDKEENESSGDDADDEEEEEGEEEEEHLAPADSVPPPQTGTRGARMTVRPYPPMAASTEALIAAVAATLPLPSPPPSPLTSYSSPLPHIPSPPLPIILTHPLGYRATMIRLRAESPSTSHPLPLPLRIVLPRTKASMVLMRAAAPSTYILLAPRSPSGTPPLLPIPLPTSSPPLLLPFTDCRADVPEVTLLPRKRLCIAPGPRYKIGESSSAPIARPTGGFRAINGFVGTSGCRDLDVTQQGRDSYGITDIWEILMRLQRRYQQLMEDPDEIAEEIPATDVVELGQRMTDFVTTVRQDTYEIYGRLDDAQDDRLVMSGQLNLLRRDRRSHARTARLMEGEARASREAWVQSMDASDTTRSKVRELQTMVLAQHTEIGDLQAADHRRQTQLTEALTLLRTLQTQMAALQSQQTPARDPTHPDVPEEAGSSS